MPDAVLLIHGLGRTGLSMLPMARALRRAGFAPEVVDYPSRKHSVEALVERVVVPQVEGRRAGQKVHFVTHSLGGVLVRAYAAARADAGRPLEGSRAVMLAPPHAGSEVADRLGRHRPVQLALGPALGDLGTGAAGPRRLGPVRGIEAGVIAGTRALVPFGRMFDGPHDGLVSVASAHAPDGIADRAVVSKTHALLMMSPAVIRLTLRFLKTGSFAQGGAGSGGP